MATKPKAKPAPAKAAGGGYDRKARAAVRAMADFIAALPRQPESAEAHRAAVLDAARALGWKG